MVDENDGTAAESRPPTLADLVALCRALNEENAQYVIIGGMAIIHAGFVRATEVFDILIDASKDNVNRESFDRRSVDAVCETGVIMGD